ncbi:SSU ribosomal protein S1p [hydrothermal vent metagenome]|uniref:SSU ribosomal protein S1p n=1 Tax=hydrothermal vent metagenome TaxID=652676 RepID=A0A3B1DDD4_9ZZZZ
MVDRNLIREYQIDEDEVARAMAIAAEDLTTEIDDPDLEDWEKLIISPESDIEVNKIIEGTILRVNGEEVLVDIGYKSEGIVLLEEWEEGETPPEPGQKIEILLEEVEDQFGLLLLSKRKADRIRQWEEVITKYTEGDIVTGSVVRKIKGGLLINIGVNVFLPASQVDIRRPRDIAEFIGKDIECVILKIDEARRNIVVSRRKLIEDARNQLKEELFSRISENDLVKGVVKNIADFGAFVDLGGIDGLLHITDMTWDRISHPSDMVKIDDEIEVIVLSIDNEKEKIALGLKQKEPSPWENIDTRYPIGEKVTGSVVNVMSYGAFVKLEAGVEGLVHISEMSWTKRINHPSELVAIGDEVEVIVLGLNKEKQEISLGMKQTQPNPWDKVMESYSPGTEVTGTVRNLTNYGAFIELEEGVDGLLHVSDMSWTRKISHANELLKKGDDLTCQVLSIDLDRKRIALGLKQLSEDPWEAQIPDKYQPGTILIGKATKITNFGVFIELEENLEGLLHISELADHKIESPEDVVSVGEELEVRVIRVDTIDRKIGLSKKLEATPEEIAAVTEGGDGVTAAVGGALLGGTGEGAGPLFSMGTEEKAAAQSETTESETAEEAETTEIAEETATTEDAVAEETVTTEETKAPAEVEEEPAEKVEEASTEEENTEEEVPEEE